jgi:hypothetical protein
MLLTIGIMAACFAVWNAVKAVVGAVKAKRARKGCKAVYLDSYAVFERECGVVLPGGSGGHFCEEFLA